MVSKLPCLFYSLFLITTVQILLPPPPHVLRHTFSVTAVQKSISLPSLQLLFEHNHLTTEIYLNLIPKDVFRDIMRSSKVYLPVTNLNSLKPSFLNQKATSKTKIILFFEAYFLHINHLTWSDPRCYKSKC